MFCYLWFCYFIYGYVLYLFYFWFCYFIYGYVFYLFYLWFCFLFILFIVLLFNIVVLFSRHGMHNNNYFLKFQVYSSSFFIIFTTADYIFETKNYLKNWRFATALIYNAIFCIVWNWYIKNPGIMNNKMIVYILKLLI